MTSLWERICERIIDPFNDGKNDLGGAIRPSPVQGWRRASFCTNMLISRGKLGAFLDHRGKAAKQVISIVN